MTRVRWMRRGWLVLALLAAAFVTGFRPVVQALRPEPPGQKIRLWHAWRGGEEELLHEQLRRFNTQHAGQIYVEPQAVPHQTFKEKLLRNVPRGAGPDLFINAHNELGELHAAGVVRAISKGSLPYGGDYLPKLLGGASTGGSLFGMPLTFKGLFLFVNTRLCPDGPPRDTLHLDALRQRLPDGTFPLAYDATSLFFHAPLFTAAGGKLFDASGQPTMLDEPGLSSFRLPDEWKRHGIIPPQPDYNEMLRLFETGHAAAIICGGWYTPGGEIAERNEWDVAPLFRVNGQPAGSFVTVEAVFVTASSRHAGVAEQVAAYLAGPQCAAERLARLSLPPPDRANWNDPATVAQMPRMVQVQRAALDHGAVTPNTPAMATLWTPAHDVLEAAVAGRDVDDAARRAQRELDRAIAPPPAPADWRPFGAGLAVLLVALTVWLVLKRAGDVSPRVRLAAHHLTGFNGRAALPFLVPGVLAVIVLVMLPLIAGALISLFVHHNGQFTFVGLQNFGRILAPEAGEVFVARSFWFALAVTVLWTVVNVALHVIIGVALALLLRPAWVRLRAGWRLVLILPWAIPNYITALVWKGMFHTQIGAINALIGGVHGLLGLGEWQPINWFDRFLTAFTANVVTNVWLGFPFMMVVTLGALQTVPRDLDDAARLDGASPWQRFWFVTLPHLRPALLPAVILGTVWTFNMFNVIYLVSGGAPGSQTDILVSEAYRWAFERGHRFGYAAAYSVLIFLVLVVWSRLTWGVSRPKEEPA